MKNVEKLFYLLTWNFNWDWNWNCHWSWNDLRECQKIWGGLCILYCMYRGGFAPRIGTVQNTGIQAWTFSVFSSLPIQPAELEMSWLGNELNWKWALGNVCSLSALRGLPRFLKVVGPLVWPSFTVRSLSEPVNVGFGPQNDSAANAQVGTTVYPSAQFRLWISQS